MMNFHLDGHLQWCNTEMPKLGEEINGKFKIARIFNNLFIHRLLCLLYFQNAEL